MALSTQCQLAWSRVLLAGFGEHVGDKLGAADLSRLCGASSALRLGRGCYAEKAIRAQHGLAAAGGGLAELHHFERMPRAKRIDLRRRGARRVVAGSPLHRIRVGGFALVSVQMLPGSVYN